MKNIISRIASFAIGVALIVGMVFPAQAAFPVKYHPGHYMLTYFGWLDTNAFKAIINEPNFIGVQKRYPWKLLEPTRGNYDFSMIVRDLNYLKSLPTPKRLIIEITDNGVDGNGVSHVPTYLTTAEFEYGIYKSAFRGLTAAKRWNTNVQTRQIALFTALGARFDKEPYIEGVVLDETATGIRLEEWTQATYTAEKQYAGLKRIMSGLKAAFPNTMCIQYINFFSGLTSADGVAKITGLMQHAFQIGMGIGGPDVHVGGSEPTYPLYGQYAGSMPLAPAVQWEDYGWLNPITGTRATVPQILDFANRTLYANYISWLQKEPEFTNEVIPLVRLTGAPSNSALPTTTSTTTTTSTAPTVSLSPAYYGTEGTAATVTVYRATSTSTAFSVTYATANGTAKAGSDYTAVKGTLSWAAGESGSKKFAVPIWKDGRSEPKETIKLTLSNPSNGAIITPTGGAVLYISGN
ncbi:MAG: Calx-beta domain-containing protein [Gammaproteobacteria bacterium]